MTPKRNRASKKILDAKIWKGGRSVHAGSLTFRFFESKNPKPPQISFIVPKTAGTAVARNTLRRRGYAVLARHLPSLPQGLVGAMIYNPKSVDKKENEKNTDHINKLVSEVLKNFL